MINSLSENSSLLCLSLNGNSLDDEHADTLSEMLKNNKTLIQLELQNNQIQDYSILGKIQDSLRSNWNEYKAERESERNERIAMGKELEIQRILNTQCETTKMMEDQFLLEEKERQLE